MKAVEINKTGGAEVLEIKDISLSKPGPEEVTIEQKAIGLNYIDTYHRSGLYPLKLPISLGLEGAGIITDKGENVKNFKVGDKISYAGIPLGSYSTHRNYPTKNLVKVPENIDLEVAATLMTKGLTTYYLLHRTYPVKSSKLSKFIFTFSAILVVPAFPGKQKILSILVDFFKISQIACSLPPLPIIPTFI